MSHNIKKQRTLKSGKIVPELESAITLTVYTKCPEKYKLIDMETGEEYVGHSTSGKNSWNKLEKNYGIFRQSS